MKKIIKWFTESNRYIHFFGGVIIMLAMFAYSYPAGISFVSGLILVTIANFLAAVFIELKDKQYGGLIDWRDVAAQMTIVVCAWVLYLLIIVVRAIV